MKNAVAQRGIRHPFSSCQSAQITIVAGCVLNLLACGGAEPTPTDPHAGKGDTEVGSGCMWNWQCKRSEGDTCRPESSEGELRCGPPHPGMGFCWDPDDCASSLCATNTDQNKPGLCFPAALECKSVEGNWMSCAEPALSPEPEPEGATSYSPYCQSQSVCVMPTALPLGTRCSCNGLEGRVIP